VQRESEWSFRAQQACHQVWSSPDSLTFLSDGRLHYDFREDRIVIKYLKPSRASQGQTVWLADFDAPLAPIHNGTQRVPHAGHCGLAILSAPRLPRRRAPPLHEKVAGYRASE
jgi:hypothetical protein